MKNRQQNKLKSYQSRNVLFFGTIEIWQVNKPFAGGVADFRNALSNLTRLAQQQLQSSGIPLDKETARKDVLDAILPIAGEVASYAAKIKNNDLLVKTDYNASDFTRAKENNLVLMCNNIMEVAQGNLDALIAGEYNVTAAELLDLSHKISLFSGMIGQPQEISGEGAVTTEALAVAFDGVDKIFAEQLDKLILQFEKTNLDFVAKYWNACQIIDSAATHNVTPTPPTPPPQNPSAK